jgi:elongation factor G
MAFKIVEDPFGQLTFMRIYQGRSRRAHVRQPADRPQGTLQPHRADARRQAGGHRYASAGDIVAVMGIDCASGDTYAIEPNYCTLESMFVPEPVIKMAITPATANGRRQDGKALHRFRKEDPTFRVRPTRRPTKTLIAGMGELHLEVYVERIRREYKVEVEVGAPKVSYREAPTQPASSTTHKKQTGGSGQYAHIVGHSNRWPTGATSLGLRGAVVAVAFPSSTSRRSKGFPRLWPRARGRFPSWARAW